MTKTKKEITFYDLNQESLDRIGEGHQVLGITKKGKYVLGRTLFNVYTGKVYDTMYYAVKIAQLD